METESGNTETRTGLREQLQLGGDGPRRYSTNYLQAVAQGDLGDKNRGVPSIFICKADMGNQMLRHRTDAGGPGKAPATDACSTCYAMDTFWTALVRTRMKARLPSRQTPLPRQPLRSLSTSEGVGLHKYTRRLRPAAPS